MFSLEAGSLRDGNFYNQTPGQNAEVTVMRSSANVKLASFGGGGILAVGKWESKQQVEVPSTKA